MTNNTYLKSRKFKYGSVATAFTVAFIAIVVIFNIIFTALAGKYMWYIDMTEEQLFTLSEEAKEIMSDIKSDVNIYFASEPDVLMTGQNSGYMKYIYTTALQLQDEFKNVHVECVDVLKNPSFFRSTRPRRPTSTPTPSLSKAAAKSAYSLRKHSSASATSPTRPPYGHTSVKTR